METLIRKQHEGVDENPVKGIEEHEANLAKYAVLRRAYQDQQAAGLMSLEELRSRLEELDASSREAEAGMVALRRSKDRAEESRRNKEAALASLSEIVPDELDGLTGEERNTVYRMLQLQVTPAPEATARAGF